MLDIIPQMRRASLVHEQQRRRENEFVVRQIFRRMNHGGVDMVFKQRAVIEIQVPLVTKIRMRVSVVQRPVTMKIAEPRHFRLRAGVFNFSGGGFYFADGLLDFKIATARLAVTFQHGMLEVFDAVGKLSPLKPEDRLRAVRDFLMRPRVENSRLWQSATRAESAADLRLGHPKRRAFPAARHRKREAGHRRMILAVGGVAVFILQRPRERIIVQRHDVELLAKFVKVEQVKKTAGADIVRDDFPRRNLLDAIRLQFRVGQKRFGEKVVKVEQS